MAADRQVSAASCAEETTMNTHPILLACVPALFEAKLRAELPEAEFQVITDGSGAHRLANGAVALVWLAHDVESGFRTAHGLAVAGARVILVGPSKDADLILRAMRGGASEFVLAGDDAALVRAVRAQYRPPHAAEAGGVHCVFPSKGGVGATMIATNLSAALQRTGKRVCLLDLDLNLGDVLSFLDLGGGYALSDVIANMRRLDRNLLDASLLRHSSGVHVLAQSHRIEEAELVDAAAIAALLQFLRQHYDAIVVDGLRTFDDLALTALDAAESVLLVVTQEVPAVRNARRCVELFRRLGHERLLKLVVNRYTKASEISADVVAETAGIPISATIGNDYPSVVKAVNKGVLLADHAPRAQVTHEIDGLLALLGQVGPSVHSAGRKSLFNRFFAPRLSHAVE
jgi:pilus assembly protein CpaE